MMRGGEAATGFSADALQARSMATAAIARKLLKDPRDAADAFTAGIVHDIGELVRATREPRQWSRVHRAAAQERVGSWVVEGREGRFTHADEGAYLLGIWGLPYSIVEAVAYHHDPGHLRTDVFGVPEAVYVSVGLAAALRGEPEAGPDPDWLAKAGLRAELPRWRELAKAAVERGT